MQLHIKQCIIDFGPVYSFWCYSFERYNGILGDYPTNNCNITVQLMRKFMDSHFATTSYLNRSSSFNLPSLESLNLVAKENSGLCDVVQIYKFRASNQLDPDFLLSSNHCFLSGGRIKCLPQDDVSQLEMCLQNIFPDCTLTINHMARTYSRVQIGRDTIACRSYHASQNRHQFFLCVMATKVDQGMFLIFLKLA